MKLIGVVLCGGKSSRMGTDKGLIKNDDGQIWAMSAYEKLHSCTDEVYVSVNETQVEAYSKYFPSDCLIVDSFSSSFTNSALNGMISASQFLGDEDACFFLPCDMIAMETGLLRTLKNNYLSTRGRTGYNSAFFECGGKIQPLVSVLNKKALEVLKGKVSGLVSSCSLVSLLLAKDMLPLKINLESANLTSFRNRNSPD